ncbi:hypothetical protein AAY473_038598 [Plecturocebus cupreus]
MFRAHGIFPLHLSHNRGLSDPIQLAVPHDFYLLDLAALHVSPHRVRLLLVHRMGKVLHQCLGESVEALDSGSRWRPRVGADSTQH